MHLSGERQWGFERKRADHCGKTKGRAGDGPTMEHGDMAKAWRLEQSDLSLQRNRVTRLIDRNIDHFCRRHFDLTVWFFDPLRLDIDVDGHRSLAHTTD